MFERAEASDADVLRVARAGAIGGALLGLGLTLFFTTVLDALRFFYSILTVVLFVPVTAGLYVHGVSAREGVGSVAAGVTVLAIVTVTTGGAISPHGSKALSQLVFAV